LDKPIFKMKVFSIWVKHYESIQ